MAKNGNNTSSNRNLLQILHNILSTIFKYISKILKFDPKNDQNPMQKWLFNVILPVIAVFTLFNIAVSGEAVENFAKALRLRKQVSNYASINITEAIEQAALAAAKAAQNERNAVNMKNGGQNGQNGQNSQNSPKSEQSDPHSDHLVSIAKRLDQLLQKGERPALEDLKELRDELAAAHSKQLNKAAESLFAASGSISDKFSFSSMHTTELPKVTGSFKTTKSTKAPHTTTTKQETTRDPNLPNPDDWNHPNAPVQIPQSFLDADMNSNSPSSSLNLPNSQHSQNPQTSQNGNSLSVPDNQQNPSSGSHLDFLSPNPSKTSSTYELQNQHCIRFLPDWHTEITPKYQLDPSKILVPALHQGPNNQIFGFRESIILAIKLNRTLVQCVHKLE